MSPVQPLHVSELFYFLVLAGLPKSAQKNKTKNNKFRPMERLDRRHRSDFFVFLITFWQKPKRPKSSHLCLLSSLSMGLNFLLFFVFGCQKALKNKKANKFRPMSPVQPLHGSELFFFWVVLAGLPKSAQNLFLIHFSLIYIQF